MIFSLLQQIKVAFLFYSDYFTHPVTNFQAESTGWWLVGFISGDVGSKRVTRSPRVQVSFSLELKKDAT